MNKSTIVSNANSKGLIADYYGFRNPSLVSDIGRVGDFSPALAKKIIENDPVVKGALITAVDKILEGSWRLQGRNKKSKQAKLEEDLKKAHFNQVLRKALFNALLYKNAFIEIVKKGDSLSDLNLLEVSLMRINAADNGDIIDYYQEAPQPPRWKPDFITHVKLDEINSDVWAQSDMKVLYDTILIKDAIRNWLRWFFQSNQMRGLYVIKGASTPKVKEFLSYLKESEKDVTKPVVVTGEVIYQMLNEFAKQGASVQTVLNWCDQQIIMLLQMPPISMGMSDSSGRSNSVEQGNALNTRVIAVHKVFEDYITYDLFPKIGYTDVDFKFGAIDAVFKTQVLENVMTMRNAQFTEEAILEYLNSNGIVFDTTNVLKNPEEIAKEAAEQANEAKMSMQTNKAVGTGNEGSIGNKSADAAPSRQRQGDSTVSKANQTRQVVKNSIPNLSGYPYTYEVK